MEYLALSSALLFLPQTVLAVVSTLNFRSRNSLKILTRHPSLIILPTITFFTFSKIKMDCTGTESRVTFSKKFTLLNIGVSAVSYLCWLFWFYFQVEEENDEYLIVFSMTASCLALSALLTILFLHVDNICCDCCLSAGELISVYDPSTDRRFILQEGAIVDIDFDGNIQTTL